jgi:hypothetical protein
MKPLDRESLRREIQRLYAEGRLPECQDLVADGLERFPADAELLNDAGVVVHSQGRLHEALGLFRAALALRPGDAEASENYLQALLGAGLWHAASRFVKEGGRGSVRLPPAPDVRRVSVCVTIPGARRTASGEDLERCLASVRAQSYPITDVVAILPPQEPGALATARAQGARCLASIGLGTPLARRASLLGARSDLVAWVDADVALDPLWLETVLLDLEPKTCAGAAGRVLEVHSNTLADRWRAVHSGADPGIAAAVPALHGGAVVYRTDVLASAAAADPTGLALLDRALAARLRRAGLALRIAPYAVAWRHRQDTIESVLDDACAEETARIEAEGAFSTLEDLAGRSALYLGRAFDRLHGDVTAGRFDLGYVDLLFFFWSVLRDVEHLASTGRVEREEAVTAGAAFLGGAFAALEGIPGIPAALLESCARTVMGGTGDFGRSIAGHVALAGRGRASWDGGVLSPIVRSLASVAEAAAPVLARVSDAVASHEGPPRAGVPVA